MSETTRNLVMRAALAIASIFVMTVAGAAASLSSATPLSSRVVKDPEDRFTIIVPANWMVQTSTSARAPAVSAESPAAAGQLPNSVDVIARDFPKAISPEECAAKVAQVMQFTIHRWTTLQEGAVTLAGLPGHSRAYTWRTSGGQERRSVQTCATVGRRAFVVIGTTANTQLGSQQDLPRLERIIATFRPNRANLPGEHPSPPSAER